jgi:hypothetical protein
MKKTMMLVMAVMAATTLSQANTPSDETTLAREVATAQLRSQDQMFALLVAAYYEVEQENIELGYERRLRALNGESKDGLGLVVHSPLEIEKYLPVSLRSLAAAERDLRTARMAKTVTDLLEIYRAARLEDQNAIGVQVPSTVDIESACKQIRQWMDSRRTRPRDPRMWAGEAPPANQAAAPKDQKATPATAASAAKPSKLAPLAKFFTPASSRNGLEGAALFGLPMLPGLLAEHP